MSLHAELTPEAQERLDAQRRNTTISSLLISVLALVLIGGVLALWALKVYTVEVPTIIAYTAENPVEESLEKRPLTETVQRKPSSPNASQSPVITAAAASNVAVPSPDVDVVDPSNDFGDGEDFGLGLGDSNGEGNGVNSGIIPSTLRKRCSLDDRLKRLDESGGNKECETVVVNALRYLKGTQAENGSWSDRGPGKPYTVGMTSLALLSYLGHCETPASAEFGETVQDAIVYLINIAKKKKGRLATDLKNGHYSYEHSIAIYALSEAYSLCKGFDITLPGLEETIKIGGQIIIDNQHTSGGWDYSYDKTSGRGGDSSIAGWHVQALKAMSHTGISFSGIKRAERKSLDYMKSLQDQSGAIAYVPGKIRDNGTTLAAVGALSYQILGKGNNSTAQKAINLIDKSMVSDYKNPVYDLYGHYYAAQVMINAGGAKWEKFNKNSRDQLLEAQEENGSFALPFGGKKKKSGNAVSSYWASATGTHYRTCLVILTLEVYYRFLPSTGT